MTPEYSEPSLMAETTVALFCLSLSSIWVFSEILIDNSEAYRYYLSDTELRYAELPISLHRETVE